MSACTNARIHELDALLHGELPPPAAAGLRAHAQGCHACARELSWLRAERAALQGRPDAWAPVVPLRAGRGSAGFSAVRARAQHLRERGRVRAGSSLAVAALGAAAALFIAVQGGPRGLPRSIDADTDVELSSNIPWCGDRPDAVGTLESQFSACLTATPRALPGSPLVCL